MAAGAGDRGGLETVVDELYRQRFPVSIRARRQAVWKVLCDSWFGRYTPPGGRVLEVGAGFCDFINNIQAAERVAVDINPDTARHAAAGVVVHQVSADELSTAVRRDWFDTVFMSNFLEHCRSRDQVLQVFREAFKVLRPGGRILILGPNFRACYKSYFDYFDHHLALTERAVVEALQLERFVPEVVKARTLPFSFRSNLPSWPWLVWAYLRLPLFWPLFGAQFFVVARKPAD